MQIPACCSQLHVINRPIVFEIHVVSFNFNELTDFCYPILATPFKVTVSEFCKSV